ncbi:MAG: rhodanese-like domain-containing protein [Bacillota bacterium]
MVRQRLLFTAIAALLLLSLALALGCAGDRQATNDPGYRDIRAAELQTLLTGDDPPFLLDVREPHEFSAGHIPGSVLIPLGEITGRLDEIPRDRTVVVICHSGNRSGQVSGELARHGYTRVLNLQDGVRDWPEPLQTE